MKDKIKFKTILYTFIFLSIFNSCYSKVSNFNFNAKNISNYFSGVVSFDNYNYQNSRSFFRQLDNFENENISYSSKFLQSLINLGRYPDALRYSKKLENKNKSVFESNIFLALHEFKRKNYIKANYYFDKIKIDPRNQGTIEILKSSFYAWSNLSQTKDIKSIERLKESNLAFNNLILIQKTFANCYLNNPNVEREFTKIIENEELNFTRLNFFYGNYLNNKNKKKEAYNFIDSSSKEYPRNLLINQFKKVLNASEKNINIFNCQDSSHVLAEIIYIIANALSSQQMYKRSNFYANLSKFLNPNFKSYNTVLAENFVLLKKNETAKKIYEQILNYGSSYKWYAAKQLTNIAKKEEEKTSTNLLKEVYNSLNKDIYDTFDYANFLRNNENYEDSVKFYSEILEIISDQHKLYPVVLERRGMAYERMDKWELGEKDLIASLQITPDEPFVMNYLAYSWVEKNKNVDEALLMLKKANNIEKNNGYITDSLGWALYKLEKFSEAKKYLQKAIILMPRDPIINDHYGDCLWMNDLKIQARYYWNNVLKLEEKDKDLKKKVEKKLLFGLGKI